MASNMATQTQTMPAVEQAASAPAEAYELPAETSLLEQALDRPLAREQAEFDLAMRYAQPAADSRYWGDAANVAQSLMKILAGKELGLSAIVSLQAVVIVKGKISISGDMIATKLREAGYRWGFLQHDENGCVLAWFKGFDEAGKPVPLIDPATGKQVTVSFTRQDAERAELAERPGAPGEKKTSGMYDKYPRSMYFNRCLAFFRRWYAPEVTNGVNVYAPEELMDAGANERAIAETAAAAGFVQPQRKAQQATQQAPMPGKPTGNGRGGQ